jgi:hypothetical protein
LYNFRKASKLLNSWVRAKTLLQVIYHNQGILSDFNESASGIIPVSAIAVPFSADVIFLNFSYFYLNEL